MFVLIFAGTLHEAMTAAVANSFGEQGTGWSFVDSIEDTHGIAAGPDVRWFKVGRYTERPVTDLVKILTHLRDFYGADNELVRLFPASADLDRPASELPNYIDGVPKGVTQLDADAARMRAQ